MFRKIIRYGGIALLVIFSAIQLVPVDRAQPPVIADVDAPVEVKEILRESCYDCHSNEVEWPWYGYVAPVSWLVAYDIEEGREELNFSNWDAHRGDAHMMEEIVEEVAEGEMPLPIYLLIHRHAAVSRDQLATLAQWAGVSPNGHGEHDDHDD